MIAHCGLNCTKCEAYLATQKNDNVKRKEVAEKWRQRYNNPDITAEQINCTGCKSDGVQFFFTQNMCQLRKCNIAKSTSHCAECPQYRCETLDAFIKIAPEIGDALERLRTR